MKNRTQTRRTKTAVLPIRLLALLFLFFFQTNNTTFAATTIVGVDLGMSPDNLDISKKLLTSVLTHATSDENFGLVIADELVRNVIDPQPADSLLVTLTDLPLNASDSGNFSALLERSLAMADISTDDTTNLWIISGGSIKLGGDADNTAKHERFQMWARDILLPDIASRYPDFQLITPASNNEKMVEAVRDYFGGTGHQLLPSTESDVDRFVDQPKLHEVTVAIAPTNSEPEDTDTSIRDAEPTKNTDIEKQTIAANIDGNTDTRVATSTPPANSIVSVEKSNESALTKPVKASLPENSAPADTNTNTDTDTDTDNSATKSDTENFSAKSNSTTKPTEAASNLLTETKTGPVADDTSAAVTIEVKENNKASSGMTLVMLGAISVVVLFFIVLFRKIRYRSASETESASFSHARPDQAQPIEPEVATDRPGTSKAPEQPQIAKPNISAPTVLQSTPVDLRSKTVVATDPAVSTDDATVVSQPGTSDETAVNQENLDHSEPPASKGVEDDFSAFDRSIIEKRWEKLDREESDKPLNKD